MVVDTESLRQMRGYWVLIQWVNDRPPVTMHGPYEEHAEAYYQARYYRQSGLWTDTVASAMVVGNGYPRSKEVNNADTGNPDDHRHGRDRGGGATEATKELGCFGEGPVQLRPPLPTHDQPVPSEGSGILGQR
jgi:hypothetical protein